MNMLNKAARTARAGAGLLQGRGREMRSWFRESPKLRTGLAVGSVLGAAALYVRYRARRAEREYPPAGQFIDVDGVRLHYIERGLGQPVVLLHGNGATACDFDGSRLIDQLARNYRVIAFDRPGFGFSDRPRMKSWNPQAQARLLSKALTRLGVQQATFIGHSWGTLVALAHALEFPEQVRGLVLVSGYYFPTFRLDALLLAPPAIPVLGDIMRYTVSPLVGRMMAPRLLRRMFHPQPVPPRFRSAVPLPMLLRPSQLRASAAESGMMATAAASMQHRYKDLRMPVMIIAGRDDRIVSLRSQAQRLRDEVPNSELRIEAGLGHMLHYMVPRVLADAVDSVAGRKSASPATATAAALP